MADFTKAQILTFLTNKSADQYRGETNPNQSTTRFFLLRIAKILIEKDVITAADVNAAFPEYL